MESGESSDSLASLGAVPCDQQNQLPRRLVTNLQVAVVSSNRILSSGPSGDQLTPFSLGRAAVATCFSLLSLRTSICSRWATSSCSRRATCSSATCIAAISDGGRTQAAGNMERISHCPGKVVARDTLVSLGRGEDVRSIAVLLHRGLRLLNCPVLSLVPTVGTPFAGDSVPGQKVAPAKLGAVVSASENDEHALDPRDPSSLSLPNPLSPIAAACGRTRPIPAPTPEPGW